MCAKPSSTSCFGPAGFAGAIDEIAELEHAGGVDDLAMLQVMAWNVTQIFPDGYVHAHALDDAAEYLVAMLAAAGEQVVRTRNHIDVDATNLVVGGHLLGDVHVDALPSSTILFNSEQLADADNALITSPYRRALAKLRVWDYSPTNLPYLPHARVTAIPFGHCPAMIRARARAESDALVFHGVITPHREVIITALRAAGVRVETAFGEYGADRDVRMFRARAILNLHKAADTAAFEAIRCFYPLTNSIPVISEASADPAADAFRDAMWWFPPAALAAEIAALWREPVAFRAEAARRTAAFAQRSSVEAIAAAIRDRG